MSLSDSQREAMRHAGIGYTNGPMTHYVEHTFNGLRTFCGRKTVAEVWPILPRTVATCRTCDHAAQARTRAVA